MFQSKSNFFKAFQTGTIQIGTVSLSTVQTVQLYKKVSEQIKSVESNSDKKNPGSSRLLSLESGDGPQQSAYVY